MAGAETVAQTFVVKVCGSSRGTTTNFNNGGCTRVRTRESKEKPQTLTTKVCATMAFTFGILPQCLTPGTYL